MSSSSSYKNQDTFSRKLTDGIEAKSLKNKYGLTREKHIYVVMTYYVVISLKIGCLIIIKFFC
jgi:hypothetical protein